MAVYVLIGLICVWYYTESCEEVVHPFAVIGVLLFWFVYVAYVLANRRNKRK